MSDLNDCVLVVEDEFIIAAAHVLDLEEMGMSVCGTAASANEAVTLARLHRPRLVLMDHRLKGAEDGMSAAMTIHDEVGSRLIFITGSRDPETLRRIEEDHAAAVLFKPLFAGELQKAVRQVLSAE